MPVGKVTASESLPSLTSPPQALCHRAAEWRAGHADKFRAVSCTSPPPLLRPSHSEEVDGKLQLQAAHVNMLYDLSLRLKIHFCLSGKGTAFREVLSGGGKKNKNSALYALVKSTAGSFACSGAASRLEKRGPLIGKSISKGVRSVFIINLIKEACTGEQRGGGGGLLISNKNAAGVAGWGLVRAPLSPQEGARRTHYDGRHDPVK